MYFINQMLQFEIVLISNILYLIFKYFRNYPLINQFPPKEIFTGKACFHHLPEALV